METKKTEPVVKTEPTVAASETHITGEIAGGVLIASVIVASVSLWAIGLVNLVLL